MKYDKILSPIKIGNVLVKNRTIFPPISTNFADDKGYITEKFIRHYSRRAEGGVGLIIIENSAIDFLNAKKGRFQPRIDVEEVVPHFTKLTQRVHKYGAKISVELTHPGFADKTVDNLTENQIEDLIKKYAFAAFVAKSSGFDMVEIQGAHGLLVNLFLSPLSNHRNDVWGNPTLFAVRVREAISKKCGSDFPVTIRLAVEDFNDEGITMSIGKEYAKILADAGYDMIQADLGLVPKEDRLEPMSYKEGWRSYLAREIGPLKVPITAVGVIRSPKTAQEILKNGADMVALGRTLIADPDWVKKIENDREETIRKCIGCSQCIIDRHDKDVAIHCGVNPNVGNEETIEKALKAKKIAVIGCGPAGLETSRVLLMRGHSVDLYCKEFGGQLSMASVPPGKSKIKWLMNYYKNVLFQNENLNLIKSEADENNLKDSKYDHIVLATGAEPILPFVQNDKVLSYEKILRLEVDIKSKKIVVCGGGLIGAETAEFLSKNNDVMIIEMRDEIAIGMETLTRKTLMKHLDENGVKILTDRRILSIENGRIKVENLKTKDEELYEADYFIEAFGNKPYKIVEDGDKYIFIGDCNKVGKIVDAVHDGYNAAKTL